MLYNIGDVLIFKDAVNTQCLEMCKPPFIIEVDDKYMITDKDDYPDDTHCHWYEFTSEKDENVILNAWNDENHMIRDDKFEKVKQRVL